MEYMLCDTEFVRSKAACKYIGKIDPPTNLDSIIKKLLATYLGV
jgi:hypothetical protein